MQRSADHRTIFVQLPGDVFELVATALPAATLVHLPTPTADHPAAAPGDILFTTAMGGAHVPRLVGKGVQWIHLAGTGIDHFNVHDAEGCTITCSRGASAGPIAEYVLATMLAFEKRLPEAWLHEPPQRWGYEHRLGTLDGKTLGLIGVGAIGEAVARRARPFGMKIVACRRNPDVHGPEGIEITSVQRVLESADHLVLAAPSTPSTHRMLDARAIAQLRPGVHLVNIARGSLIDHDALLRALDDGIVARASLDVSDPEPLPAGHPLFTHPSVHLTPHVSWSAPGVEQQWVTSFTNNFRRFDAGEPLLDVVEPVRGY